MLHSKHIVTTSNAHLWTGEELQSRVSPSSVFQISVDKVPHFLNQEFAQFNVFERNKTADHIETGQTEPILTNTIFNLQIQNSDGYAEKASTANIGIQPIEVPLNETEADEFLHQLKS